MSSNGSAPATGVPPAHGPVLTAEPDEQGRRQRSRRPPASAPAIAPAKTRRRSGVLAAGLALVVVGALGAAYLTQVVGDTVQVVAVAQDVQPGELIERADLTVADVSVDPALTPVPATRLTEFVGQRAAVALTAGSLLTDAAVSEPVLPAAGQSLVGVALQSAQLPAEPLQAGDRIRIVDTPASQAEPPASTPQTIPGVVVSASPADDDSGLTVVDITVPSGQAADLAARVATGRIALVLDSRER
jgi:flagella basal body P-ring formation protein FlgA